MLHPNLYYLLMKFFYLLILFPIVLFSQKEGSAKHFDSIFFNNSLNNSFSDPTRAMHVADSLLVMAKNENEKIELTMLLADILAKQENIGDAILYAQNALQIAIRENDYIFQVRIYVFLSTQYRTIGFLDKGKSFLNKGLKTCEFVENKEHVVKYGAMIQQKFAEYALDEKAYEKAIEYLKSVILTFETEKNLQFKFFLLANAEEMLARANLGLGKEQESFIHFSKAKFYINKSQEEDTFWAALVYTGLGNGFLNKKNTDSAGFYFKKALIISEKSDQGSLKENVYKAMADYYKNTNQMDSMNLYNVKYKSISAINSEQKKRLINSTYNTSKERPIAEITDTKFYLIINGAALLLVISVVFYYKREVKPLSIKVEPVPIENKSGEIVLSEKTEKELLEKLQRFEVSYDYLDKNMSMSTLIGLLNTNAKYLRQILKKHKNTNYTQYINGLRIQYIVDKLKTDSDYLSYKISYLAEESGFSSHSKFTAYFKNFTDMSPSEFIGKLNHDSA